MTSRLVVANVLLVVLGVFVILTGVGTIPFKGWPLLLVLLLVGVVMVAVVSSRPTTERSRSVRR